MFEFERPPHIVYPDPADVRSARIRMLYDYWRSKCVDGRLPARASIEPGDIRPLLPHLILAELGRAPLKIHYRLVGTAVAKRHRDDFTGRDHESVTTLFGAGLEEAYRRVAEHGLAVFGRSGLNAGDHSWIPFEYAILPLSDDGVTVNKCLAIECTGETEHTALAFAEKQPAPVPKRPL